jgi:predicted ArsR family transcriptional regulator
MTDISEINNVKSGTKEAALVNALQSKGKTIEQLTTLLDWQPHTVRAALTRLRKRGYIIDRIPKTARVAAKFKIRSLKT